MHKTVRRIGLPADARTAGPHDHPGGGSYKTALALASVALMLPATAAAAEETKPPGPPPINACGSTLTIEEVKANFKERPSETGFAVSGNLVLRISDKDSSVVVRLPGRFSVEFTGPETGIVTQTGRTLLIPTFPFQAAAIARAGLPQLPLISGRVVINETFDPITGAPVADILSVDGHVTDVCELLAR